MMMTAITYPGLDTSAGHLHFVISQQSTSILLIKVISHYQNNTLLTCICSIWPNDNISIIIYLLKKQHSFEKEEKGNFWKWQIYYTPNGFYDFIKWPQSPIIHSPENESQHVEQWFAT